MRVVASSRSCARIDVRGPWRRVTRISGPEGQCLAKAVIARPAKHDAARLAAGVRDGRHPRFCGELIFALESFTDIAELGEDLGSVDAAAARERHDDSPVCELSDLVLDTCGEQLQLGNQLLEHASERTDEFAFRVCFDGGQSPAGAARRRSRSSPTGRRPV